MIGECRFGDRQWYRRVGIGFDVRLRRELVKLNPPIAHPCNLANVIDPTGNESIVIGDRSCQRHNRLKAAQLVGFTRLTSSRVSQWSLVQLNTVPAGGTPLDNRPLVPILCGASQLAQVRMFLHFSLAMSSRRESLVSSCQCYLRWSFADASNASSKQNIRECP